MSETLFDYCDYDHSGFLSVEEFTACYCTGFYEPHEGGSEVEECLLSAGTEFALIDTAAVENVGKLSKHEFGLFWDAVECNSSSVDDLYHTWDADQDGLFNYDEFAGLFCTVECDGGVHMDHMHYVVEQTHPDHSEDCEGDTQWNMELCQCVSTLQCDLVCEAPLLKDPINGCDCITLTEYLALYDHGLDEHCKPIDGDCADCHRSINVFNFYAPVYGDVSGFADGHVSNIAADCDEDDHTSDINANDVGDLEGEEGANDNENGSSEGEDGNEEENVDQGGEED